MCALGDREIDYARERLPQSCAALRELLERHLGVVPTEVVVGGADEFNNFGCSIYDLGFDEAVGFEPLI